LSRLSPVPFGIFLYLEKKEKVESIKPVKEVELRVTKFHTEQTQESKIT